MCAKCKEIKPRQDFAKGEFSKKSSRCRLCKQERQAQYDNAHKKEKSEYNRSYGVKNRDRRAARNRKRLKEKRDNDFVYNFMQNISINIRRMLKRQKSSKKGRSCRKFLPFTEKQFIDHFSLLFLHPDNLLPNGKPWMSWNNHGDYKLETWNDYDSLTWRWHIDHIIPQSKLKFDDLEHPNFAKCWSLDNLRPLRADLNVKRGNRDY